MAEEIVVIPNGVDLSLNKSELTVKGGKGELKRAFRHPRIKLEIKDGKVRVSSNVERKEVRSVVGTWAALINNMILGVSKGWQCELRLVHSHFPAKMSVKDNQFIIQNFLGEKKPRIAKISSGVEIKVDKDTIVIKGTDKEKVGQAGGSIEKATRVIGYDRRVFQDGCYITQKAFVGEN